MSHKKRLGRKIKLSDFFRELVRYRYGKEMDEIYLFVPWLPDDDAVMPMFPCEFLSRSRSFFEPGEILVEDELISQLEKKHLLKLL